MGCGANGRHDLNQPISEEVSYICNISRDEILIQSLGRFGDLPFNLNFNYEFGKGKAYSIFQNNVYFSGGEKKTKDFGVIIIIFYERRGRLEFKQQMITERTNHQLITLNSQSLIAIGGYQTKKVNPISECEMYKTYEDKWIKLADIPSTKKGMTTISYKERYLYTFFGTNEAEPKCTIYNYDASYNKWTLVEITGLSYNPFKEKSFGLPLTNQSNFILIFGGGNENENLSTYLFDTFALKITPIATDCITKTIIREEGIQPVIFQNRIYILGSTTLYCHIFSIKSEDWEISHFAVT